MARLRLGVLVSGRGSNLQALIDAARAPDYPAEVALVISNENNAAGLARAQAAGIASRPISHREPGFEGLIDTALTEADVDLVCLAGFMRVLSADFVRQWRGRLINIHPSLLPAFPGLNTHRRALAAGVKSSGCTVHFVTDTVDGGPIIAQSEVPILAGDDEASLAARILREEHRLYPRVVRLIAEGRVHVDGDKVEIR